MKIKILLLSLLAILPACSTTKLSLVWNDTAFTQKPLRKILVIGMTEKENVRRGFEYQVSKQFEAAGVSALTSFGKVTLGANVSKDQVVAQIKPLGVDSVIVSRLLAVDTETQVTPATVSYVPEAVSFGSYYATAQTQVYNPAYTMDFKVFKIETRIFSVATESLIWSGTSETTDPASAQHLIEAVAKAVIKDIQAKGLIETKRK